MADRALRTVLTLHLPVPMELLIEVQAALLRAYPELGRRPASEVMDSNGDTVAFLVPGDDA